MATLPKPPAGSNDPERAKGQSERLVWQISNANRQARRRNDADQPPRPRPFAAFDDGADEGRQCEGGLVDGRRVIARPEIRRGEAGLEDGERRGAVGRLVTAPAQRHEAADIGRNHRQIASGIGEQRGEIGNRILELGRLQERHATLGDEDAARLQQALAVGMEGPGEQHFAWPDRIGGVDDDQVEARGGASGVILAVADDQLEPGIIETPAVEIGKMGPGKVDDARVDLDHDQALHAAVLQNFLGEPAIPAADDQHVLGRAMGKQRHMRHHLVIDELVAHRDLGGAVERDQAAEPHGVDDDQALVRRGEIIEDFGHPVFGGKPILLMQGLAVPERAVGPPRQAVLAAHRLPRPSTAQAPSPRRCSVSRISRGRKARRSTPTQSSGRASPHMKMSRAA